MTMIFSRYRILLVDSRRLFPNGVPSWSRSVEAAEAARARLVRWACGDPAVDQDPAPRKKMPHALRRRWPFCPCLQRDLPHAKFVCLDSSEGTNELHQQWNLKSNLNCPQNRTNKDHNASFTRGQ
ncbi:hypothetical protein RR48_00593 [Papilio machaon]|uniref:Uncharacterized protein n=1 Tax=Papilio machaon TaxID=76193 RepID=A0A0N1ICJ2_PAPMA|nr:hypothetical protein RR48_00593 [Papilio machaon]